MPPRRQLAAIMFTDIVGYTALMGEDDPVVNVPENSRHPLSTLPGGEIVAHEDQVSPRGIGGLEGTVTRKEADGPASEAAPPAVFPTVQGVALPS